ncbi:MAG: hypothetical protein MZV70_39465 [Desulfobacterales bacterium]|nr:hypothetical protein [Desulfobacterales bacterium]
MAETQAGLAKRNPACTDWILFRIAEAGETGQRTTAGRQELTLAVAG